MPLDYLIWQSGKKKVQDCAADVYQTMKRMGRQVVQNGAVVDDDNQALALLRDTVTLYDRHVGQVLMAGVET